MSSQHHQQHDQHKSQQEGDQSNLLKMPYALLERHFRVKARTYKNRELDMFLLSVRNESQNRASEYSKPAVIWSSVQDPNLDLLNRNCHTTVLWDNTTVFVIGGFSTSSRSQRESTVSSLCLNLPKMTAFPTPSSLPPLDRYSCSATRCGNSILVFGGFIAAQKRWTNSLYQITLEQVTPYNRFHIAAGAQSQLHLPMQTPLSTSQLPPASSQAELTITPASVSSPPQSQAQPQPSSQNPHTTPFSTQSTQMNPSDAALSLGGNSLNLSSVLSPQPSQSTNPHNHNHHHHHHHHAHRLPSLSQQAPPCLNWKLVKPLGKGPIPVARAAHTATAIEVYPSEPTTDHSFPPKRPDRSPISAKLFILGGNDTDCYHRDLSTFDVLTSSWVPTQLLPTISLSGKTESIALLNRAGHTTVSFSNRFLISFGGMDRDGGLNALTCIDTDPMADIFINNDYTTLLTPFNPLTDSHLIKHATIDSEIPTTPTHSNSNQQQQQQQQQQQTDSSTNSSTQQSQSVQSPAQNQPQQPHPLLSLHPYHTPPPPDCALSSPYKHQMFSPRHPDHQYVTNIPVIECNLTDKPSPRAGHAMVMIAPNRAVIFGGTAPSNDSTSTPLLFNELYTLEFSIQVLPIYIAEINKHVNQLHLVCTWGNPSSVGQRPRPSAGMTLTAYLDEYTNTTKVISIGGGDMNASTNGVLTFDADFKHNQHPHTTQQSRATPILTDLNKNASTDQIGPSVDLLPPISPTASQITPVDADRSANQSQHMAVSTYSTPHQQQAARHVSSPSSTKLYDSFKSVHSQLSTISASTTNNDTQSALSAQSNHHPNQQQFLDNEKSPVLLTTHNQYSTTQPTTRHIASLEPPPPILPPFPTIIQNYCQDKIIQYSSQVSPQSHSNDYLQLALAHIPHPQQSQQNANASNAAMFDDLLDLYKNPNFLYSPPSQHLQGQCAGQFTANPALYPEQIVSATAAAVSDLVLSLSTQTTLYYQQLLHAQHNGFHLTPPPPNVPSDNSNDDTDDSPESALAKTTGAIAKLQRQYHAITEVHNKQIQSVLELVDLVRLHHLYSHLGAVQNVLDQTQQYLQSCHQNQYYLRYIHQSEQRASAKLGPLSTPLDPANVDISPVHGGTNSTSNQQQQQQQPNPNIQSTTSLPSSPSPNYTDDQPSQQQKDIIVRSVYHSHLNDLNELAKTVCEESELQLLTLQRQLAPSIPPPQSTQQAQHPYNPSQSQPYNPTATHNFNPHTAHSTTNHPQQSQPQYRHLLSNSATHSNPLYNSPNPQYPNHHHHHQHSQNSQPPSQPHSYQQQQQQQQQQRPRGQPTPNFSSTGTDVLYQPLPNLNTPHYQVNPPHQQPRPLQLSQHSVQSRSNQQSGPPPYHQQSQ